jgi:hypothetical protein
MRYPLIVAEVCDTLRRLVAGKAEAAPVATVTLTTPIVAVLLFALWHTFSWLLWPAGGSRWGSVHGQVTSVTGEPVEGVVVLFIDDHAGVGASGKTDSSGAYRACGIQAGQYVVAVQPLIDTTDHEIRREDVLAAREQLETSVPSRFQDPLSSGLTAGLKGGRNRYDIDLRNHR